MAGVRFQSVRKIYGKDVVAVDDVDLVVDDGEFVVLLGPSGCGKTTLLRCLAGLEQVNGGRVYIGDRDVTDVPPRARGIAMVFQSYAVFPHLKVGDNIAFGLRMQKEDSEEVTRRVNEAAELLHIDQLLDRYPAQLSGGQRQRVAVARAIATNAEVLLMDEPLSNLDALLRMEARAELKRLVQELGVTTLYVTHDQVEGLSMGDRIAVMNAGQLVQVDSPLTVYDDPADTFVGGFIGNPPMNFIAAEVEAGAGTPRVRLSGGDLSLPLSDVDHLAGRPLMMGIRAENIEVCKEPAEGLVRAKVRVLEPLGSHNLLTVRSGDDALKVAASADLFPPTDSDVWLRIEPERIRWMDRETGEALAVSGVNGPNGSSAPATP